MTATSYPIDNEYECDLQACLKRLEVEAIRVTEAQISKTDSFFSFALWTNDHKSFIHSHNFLGKGDFNYVKYFLSRYPGTF